LKNGKNTFFAKDFIETTEGLCFAVVKNGVEQGRVLCFLRYVYVDSRWKKLNTTQANQLLTERYPHYLYYSKSVDAYLHGVEENKIVQHYQPKQRLQSLLDLSSFKKPTGLDEVSADLIILCQLLQNSGIDLHPVGVTGSLLINAQNPDSDIDLVFYNRNSFQQARQVSATLIEQQKLDALTEQDWQDSFQRRDCELNFADYVWHEQRKYNKALINRRKFDLSLVLETQEAIESYSKLGSVTLSVQISDDRYGFDYPAQFLLNHPDIQEILCFTATYNGQAQTGEWVEVAGQLEISEEGNKRIVVGSSREARGEYIKVLHS
jgi:hypothetical protein